MGQTIILLVLNDDEELIRIRKHRLKFEPDTFSGSIVTLFA